jgi:hypothetical protein
MDTEITINGEVSTFVSFPDAENYILGQLRSWNNFESTPLTISLKKVPSETSTLGITVTDGVETADLFGRV